MKTAEEIINQEIGLDVNAKDLTPMDRGECIRCMLAYHEQFQVLSTSGGKSKEEIEILKHNFIDWLVNPDDYALALNKLNILEMLNKFLESYRSQPADEGADEYLKGYNEGWKAYHNAYLKGKKNKGKSGINEITQERFEQIHKHGWDCTNNDYYSKGELIQAALFAIDPNRFEWPEGWDDYFRQKIINKDRLQRLRVAGALIAAEIDRIIIEKPKP